VTIGDRTLISACFTAATPTKPYDHHIRKGTLGPEVSKPITIGNDVWIGANVTVILGVSIGDRCIIGAGSVVLKSTGEGELWVGNPARLVRKVDEGKDPVDWDE